MLPLDKTATQYVEQIKSRIHEIGELVIAEKTRKQLAQQIHESRTESEHVQITKGDLVMIRRPQNADLNPAWRKLQRPWIGPLRVMAVLDKDKFLLSNWTGTVVPIVAQRREVKLYYARQLGTTEQSIITAVREGSVVMQLLAQEQVQKRRNPHQGI